MSSVFGATAGRVVLACLGDALDVPDDPHAPATNSTATTRPNERRRTVMRAKSSGRYEFGAIVPLACGFRLPNQGVLSMRKFAGLLVAAALIVPAGIIAAAPGGAAAA